MTYYGRWTYKYEEAARKGALGALIVHERDAASYPWSVVRSSFAGEQFVLPAGGGGSGVGLVGWVTTEMARQALTLGGLDLDALRRAAGERGFTAVPTGVTVRGRVASVVRSLTTENVVGVLRGSERPNEAVVLTAHYDHLGIGEPIDGDSIYNGAYDNASGVALLLATARAMAEADTHPERSVIFLATGAEEQGLLGAEWYVQHPAVPLTRTVAEVNVDGANLWGITTDIPVLGEDRGEVGSFARRRAIAMGLQIVPDPEPGSGSFFRSDHFPFARAGVPALSVGHGRDYPGRPDGWGQEIQEEYTALRYHAPADEWSDDFVFDGAVQQGTLAMLTILDLAAGDGWPTWHDGQEFKAARDEMMARR